MKTVGKIATLATSLSLSFVLAACGGSSASSSASSSAGSASDSAAASSSAIDMVATNADNTASIILAVISPSDETTGKSAEDFLKVQVEDMQKGLEGNYSYVSDEAEITFNGIDRKLPAMVTTITENDSTMVICQAVAEKDGHYLNFLSVGMNNDDVLDSFSSFKSVA